MDEPILGSLGLCRKAGKLVMGFDAVRENILKGRVFLVLLASDVSEKTEKRVRQFCEEIVPVGKLPVTQNDLCFISRKPVGVYGVADENLAGLCSKHITLDNEEESANDD